MSVRLRSAVGPSHDRGHHLFLWKPALLLRHVGGETQSIGSGTFSYICRDDRSPQLSRRSYPVITVSQQQAAFDVVDDHRPRVVQVIQVVRDAFWIEVSITLSDWLLRKVRDRDLDERHISILVLTPVGRYRRSCRAQQDAWGGGEGRTGWASCPTA